MSDIIESIKQGANQLLSNIDQDGHIKTAIDGLRHQLTEVERRRQISQKTAEIAALQTEAKQMTEALGLQTLSLYATNKIDHPELAKLCERVEELQREIEEKRAILTELKAQTPSSSTVCPKCGTQTDATAEYCPKCGTALAAKPTVPAQGVQQSAIRLRCPKCRTIVPQGAGFCPGCGVKLKMPQTAPAQKQFCNSCGAELQAAARFCPICGQAVPDQS